MKQKNGLIAMLAFVIITTFGCKPDPLEYARPANLAGTISQQLESMGTFNYYLQALSQTEFKAPLEKGGSWTVFAPTDEAFEKYMQQEGYASFDAIPPQRIQDIIDYSIVTDGWNTTTLTYFKNRFYLGQSFRRRTQYKAAHRVFKRETLNNLQHIIDWNKLDQDEYLVNYSNGRQKTVNYFLDSYMDINNIEYTDYDFMFPGETFTAGDMKVFDANVSQANVVAENGIIYALDKVLEPQKNMYENLSSIGYGDKYSMFKKMLERFSDVRLLPNQSGYSDRVNPETGETQDLYQHRFLTGIENDYLPFNPSDENYPTNIDGTLAQAWGLLAPTNEALTNYLTGNSILGKFYTSYDDMPLSVLGQFLKPNFFNNYYDIVPSSFGQSYDYGLGLVDYKPGDVVDKKFCSNGFFVGVNTVYTNTSFATILGPLLLDPDYSIMLKAVQDLGIDSGLQGIASRFTILGVRNDQFIDVADPNSPIRRITVRTDISTDEVTYMDVTGDGALRTFPDPNATTPSSADVAYVTKTLNDIVLNQILDKEIDFNSNTYYQTRSGEFVYAFDGNSAAGGGDIEKGKSVQIEGIQETVNGNFYEMSGIINRPLNFTYGTISTNPSSYSSFLEVLEKADALITIVDSDDKLINFLNLQRTFTLFVPNNTAVAQAIADGVIVDPSTVNGLADLEKAIAKRDLLNFAKKHFVQQALSTDGKTNGTFSSMYFSKIVDFAPVYDEYEIVNTTSSITITNKAAESVTTGGVTNLLSKRVIIHEIDNYLK